MRAIRLDQQRNGESLERLFDRAPAGVPVMETRGRGCCNCGSEMESMYDDATGTVCACVSCGYRRVY